MRNASGTNQFGVEASTGHTRRRFLTSIGVTSMVGVAGAAAAIDHQRSPTGGDRPHAHAEYLLASGLTYLNTASLGPTPRTVLNRTLEAWNELESNPVYMAYGDGPVLAAADRTRDQAAGLLGCTADEILITRSTTDAMNSLAQGIRLVRDDRVLMTDQEHEGGSLGWQYRSRRDGVHIDVVPLALTDHDPDEIVRRFAAAITPATRVISVSHSMAFACRRTSSTPKGTLMRRCAPFERYSHDEASARGR